MMHCFFTMGLTRYLTMLIIFGMVDRIQEIPISDISFIIYLHPKNPFKYISRIECIVSLIEIYTYPKPIAHESRVLFYDKQ